MTLDRLIRKLYAPVLGLLWAGCAYLQASALTELLGASYLATDAATIVGALDGKAPAARASDELRTADAIIARNPFDSVTGPLNATAIETPEEDAEPAKADLSDPLGVPLCAGVTVNIVTQSPDPEWSLAQLKVAAEPLALVRRVGDLAGDYEVAYIGFNPRKASPAVWMQRQGVVCQALLFSKEEPPAETAARAPVAPAPTAPTPAAPEAGGANPVPAEIASKISKVSDSEYKIERGVVDSILENQAQLMRSARIVPEQKNGKVVGIRLFGIRPDSLLGTLGLQNGDRLEQINGFDMGSPEKALEAYARLRTADKLSVKVTRRGQPMAIDYNIE